MKLLRVTPKISVSVATKGGHYGALWKFAYGKHAPSVIAFIIFIKYNVHISYFVNTFPNIIPFYIHNTFNIAQQRKKYTGSQNEAALHKLTLENKQCHFHGAVLNDIEIKCVKYL